MSSEDNPSSGGSGIVFKSEDVVGVARSKEKRGGKICGMNSLGKGPVDAARIKKIG